MKVYGKVRGKTLKNSSKGKDAEPNEAVVILVRLDPTNGIGGKLELPVDPAKSQNYELGDIITLNLDVEQGKLGLSNGDGERPSRSRAASAPKAAH